MKVRSILFVFLLSGVLNSLYSASSASAEGESPANEELVQWAIPGFSTDFSRISIDPAQIFSGGPPKDGIPAIDNPRYESIGQASEWLDSREPVVLLTMNGASRIYPLSILTWHEIVNDDLDGTPVAVTFCPLCNTGAVFQREHRGRVLDFGTTGRLSGSNLLMYDRQSESWWQQATGESVIGEFTGDHLVFVPSLNLSFDEARKAAPNADVLSRSTGYSRSYGRNPYEGYDRPGNRPFLFDGEIQSGTDPMARVLVVKHKGMERIVGYSELRPDGFLTLNLADEPIVLFWSPGTASALDSGLISEGREVGSVNAFLAIVDGEMLEFENAGEAGFVDRNSGSLWNPSGQALSGPFEGRSLTPVVGIQHFSFSANAFSVVPDE